MLFQVNIPSTDWFIGFTAPLEALLGQAGSAWHPPVALPSSISLPHLPLPHLPLPHHLTPSLWTQLATALGVGLLSAFGLQLLLALLGIALGLSLLKGSPSDPEADPTVAQTQKGGGLGWVAAGALLSVNGVLFAACFLASWLSAFGEPVGGAIAGLLIWSAYLLILVWLSTKTMNSVTGFVFDQATGGVRKLVGAVASAFRAIQPSGDAARDEAGPEPGAKTDADVNADADADADLTDAVRQEIRTALSTTEVRSLIEAQLQTLQSPASQSSVPAAPEPAPEEFWQPLTAHLAEADAKGLTPKRLNRKLEKLLAEAEQTLPAAHAMPPLPIQSLTTQIEQRQDISDRKKQRILAQLEDAWTTASQTRAALSPTSIEAPLENTESETSGLTQVLLQKVLETAAKQALPVLPKLLIQGLQGTEANVPSSLGLVPLALSGALSSGALSGALSGSLPDELPDIKKLLHDLPVDLPLEQLEKADIQQALDNLRHTAQSNLAELGQGSRENLEQLQALALKPVEAVQQGVQDQVSSFKQQAQSQVEATRRAAARAAWWLFATAASGGASAMGAGALAALLQASQGMS